MTGAMLSQERLKLLHYDQDTGIFTCLVSRGRNAKVGSIAGTVGNHGYAAIMIDRKMYLSHRLAWLYVNGEFPTNDIDHINRDRTDNRLSNLRLATRAENLQNLSMRRDNTSGHIGVYWRKDCQKWQAQIIVNHNNIYLGRFTDLSEAVAARKAAAIKFHTFQHNHQGE